MSEPDPDCPRCLGMGFYPLPFAGMFEVDCELCTREPGKKTDAELYQLHLEISADYLAKLKKDGPL